MRLADRPWTLDFTAAEKQAALASDEQLHYALLDIEKTLPGADALDRSDPLPGVSRGGFYRDHASVLRREQAARRSSR